MHFCTACPLPDVLNNDATNVLYEVCVLRFNQRAAESLQRGDRPLHNGNACVELRRHRDDLHPLEGSVAGAADVHDRHQCSRLSYVHQASARLDHVVCTDHRCVMG